MKSVGGFAIVFGWVAGGGESVASLCMSSLGVVAVMDTEAFPNGPLAPPLPSRRSFQRRRRSESAPKAKLELDDQQRQQLKAVVRRTSSAQSHVMRARIVLESAKGLDNEEVAELLGTTGQTVGKWRRRFIADGLEGLFDAPRLGAPRSVSDEVVASVIQKTLNETPKNATQWSTRSMADRLSTIESPGLPESAHAHRTRRTHGYHVGDLEFD